MSSRWAGTHATAAHVLGAVLEDESCTFALLGRDGRVWRPGAGFAAMAGTGPVFAEPLGTNIGNAVKAGARLAATGDLVIQGERRPVRVILIPARAGSVAAVLHLTDLRRERDLAERLEQSQRLQAVGELAAGIAHDFNNLLTVILGAASDLRRHTGSAGLPDLDQIAESATRGATLVRQMLAFGRRQTLQPRVLELNDVVRSTVGLLRRLLGARVQLELALEEPGRRVRVDETQLTQVLVNLAVNARDAMPDGGMLLVATGHRLVLSPELEGTDAIPPGRYATLDITDTGGGIPPDILPRIFEPFFTTKRGRGGTGLGLATVDGIVRQSGGYIAVYSTQGAGTRFRITLPRAETSARQSTGRQSTGRESTGRESTGLGSPAARAPLAGPAAAREAKPGHLLLVEDEAPVRRLTARALQRAGWQVTEADSGEAALAAADGTLTLLVSDVIMPGIDGPTLVRTLRQSNPALRALLISGYADAAQRAALEAEDISFLAKPFAPADIVPAVESLAGDSHTPPLRPAPPHPDIPAKAAS